MAMDFFVIIERLRQLNLLHRISIQRAALQCGSYFGQLPVLEYVIEHDRCTQAQLAEALQVSAPSVATSVKRMQKAGLLQKAADAEDLRCNRISITEKGLALAQKCRAGFNVVDGRMFEGFTEEECCTLCGYLDRLIANVAPEELRNKTVNALLNTVKNESCD